MRGVLADGLRAASRAWPQAQTQVTDAPEATASQSDRLSWLLLKDDIAPRVGELELLEQLRKDCEPIRVGSELGRSFAQAIRGRDLNALSAWTGQAVQTTSTKEMKGFA